MADGQAGKRGVNHEADTTDIELVEGESVLHNRHPGWGIWWKHFGGAVVVLLYSLSGDAATFQWGTLIAGIIVATVAASHNRSRYIVTDKRFIMDVGLFRPTRRADSIGNVNEIDTSQSYLSNLFGIGAITVKTSDGAETVWRGVPDHMAVARTMRETLQ